MTQSLILIIFEQKGDWIWMNSFTASEIITIPVLNKYGAKQNKRRTQSLVGDQSVT